MEGDDTDRPPCQLSERFFAAGEEPTGVRVSPYHKASGIRAILNALDSDEIDKIRESPFGRLVEIADKRPFSGRFGRYIISRQLKCSKKHEAWFLFAGKPVRFSLREFALVTGLNCKKFPNPGKRKPKNFISEKPYWGDLFGSLKEVPVSSVIRMLRKKTVADKEVRIKYALLALLSSVLLPTTHAPRISQDHAERIKDLDNFYAYPWGSVSFELLMSSIKERKELSLSQNTIALKGFVLSLQLVMVEAVPALTEAVRDGSSSGSESEDGEEDDNLDGVSSGKKSISPGHARDTDASGKAAVQSIILDENGEMKTSPDFDWSDDEDDPLVENMVKLIEERSSFKASWFVGGASRVDVCRMREEARVDLQNRKTGKVKVGSAGVVPDVLEAELVASIVGEKLKGDIALLRSDMSKMNECYIQHQNIVVDKLKQMFAKLEENQEVVANLAATVTGWRNGRDTVRPPQSARPSSAAVVGAESMPDPQSIISDAMTFANRAASRAAESEQDKEVSNHGLNGGVSEVETLPRTHGRKSGQTGTDEGVGISDLSGKEKENHPLLTERNIDSTLDPALLFPNPSFSLGVMQEERLASESNTNLAGQPGQVSADEENMVEETEEVAHACRKSKRQKLPTKALLGEYECDRRFVNRARQAVAESNFTGANIDYTAKFALLLDKMQRPFCITTDRGKIESTEMLVIVERSTQLSSKVVDVLMFHIASTSRSLPTPKDSPAHVFLDTEFVSQFTKMYSKFSKVSKKDNFKFSSNVVDLIKKNPAHADAERFYLPLNIDGNYWVGISIDCSCWTVTVLDCNIAQRKDYMMNKEVRPIAQMFPYLLKFLGKAVGARESKGMAIDRPRSIPQHNAITDSALVSVLFIQAHSVAGVDGCKCVTADVIDSEVERLLVTLYEGNMGPL